jgi:hypothetical protein
MPLTIADLLHQDVPNPSGLATMHGIARLSEMTTVQAVDDLTKVGATNITVSTIVTPHVFAPTFCMKRVYGSENKGDAKDDVVGDPDSQNSKGTVVIMIPGLKADYIAAKKQYNSMLGLVFVTQADGQVLQYGSDRFPCRFKVSWQSDKNEGYRGYTITATCYGDAVLYSPGLNFTPAV